MQWPTLVPHRHHRHLRHLRHLRPGKLLGRGNINTIVYKAPAMSNSKES